MKTSKVTIACVVLLMLQAGCAKHVTQEATRDVPAASAQKPVRVSTDNTDAAEPSAADAHDGTVYVAWVEHRENKAADVMLAHLDADGQMKDAPVRVNPNAGAATAWRGDAPTVAVAQDGTVYVGWTANLSAQKHANELLLSASRDGGRTFEAPVKVNDDAKAVEHGMHSLAVGGDGRVYVAWLDERNVVKPSSPNPNGTEQKMEHMEANREVFVAFSADGGRSFSRNQLIAKDACPCCKTALAAGANGRVFASWRQVLPGEFRHIAVAASEDGGKTFSPPVIVSDDRWMIATCPVSGPALSVGSDGALRVVWYTEGEKAPAGLYSVESRDNARTFSPNASLAKGEVRGMPQLLTNGSDQATVVWESNDGGSPRVMSVSLGREENASATALASNAELPSAAISGNRLFVSYIAKINGRRSVWIVRTEARTRGQA